METTTIAVTAFGDTREVECRVYPEATRIESLDRVVIGKFPTGTKLHRSTLTLWRRVQMRNGKTYIGHGPTVAVVDGEEYIADGTLYTHNRNVGRIIGWNDLDRQAEVVARWN